MIRYFGKSSKKEAFFKAKTRFRAVYRGMKKPKKWTTIREDSGKYLLDVSKLVLGSVVLGVVLRIDLPQDVLLTGGIAAVIVSFISGLILGTREIKPIHHPSGKVKTATRKRKRSKG